MTARTLLAIFDSIYLLALSAWIGPLVFVAFGVSPLLPSVLGTETASRFLREFLPRCYAWAAICGAIALPAYLGGPLTFPEYRSPVVALNSLVIIAGTLIMLYAGNSLAPALNAAREEGPSAEPRLRRLNTRRAWADGVTLAFAALLIVAFASRSAPRTSGIRELSPQQRARYAADVERAIERIEAERGLRQPRPRAAPSPKLSAEELRELQGYYDRGLRPATVPEPSSPVPARGLPK